MLGLGLRAVISFFATFLPNKLLHGWPMLRSVHSSLAYSQDLYVTFGECRYLMPVTGDSITTYCKSNHIADHVERIECEAGAPAANLHYINCQPSDKGKALLYFHGGGYGNPMNGPAYVPFGQQICKAAGISKLVFLEYTLTPDLRYPGQMMQALSALRYLLQTHRPSEIVIGGDSAGGNLTLAVLTHIMKQSPYTDLLELGAFYDEKLRGAILVSPWVNIEMSAPTYKSNARNDFLEAGIVKDFIEALAPKADEVYAVPLLADEKFWKALPVSRTLLTSGTWEIFDSDICSLAEKMGAARLGENAAVELARAEKEAHVQAIVDTGLGIQAPKAVMMSQVLDWSRRLP